MSIVGDSGKMISSNQKTNEVYQEQILPGVSRTFAFTIPQLPKGLREAVTNAYLLCRIADTIEDDANLTSEQKAQFLKEFQAVVEDRAPAAKLVETLVPLLSPQTLDAERDLIVNMPKVTEYTHSLNANQQNALQQCINKMTSGMHQFERNHTIAGLATLRDLDDYCYYVAGVVGELLTELFCDYSPAIRQHKNAMLNLAVSFGQGLQMTNILKDQWEDRQRNACWLPQDIFAQYGYPLSELDKQGQSSAYQLGLQHLVGVAHGHLHNALEYTLLIPGREKGIRKFCLWAIGLAVFTLRNINNKPDFKSAKDVKISRRTVKLTVTTTQMICANDYVLRWLFNLSARGLPLHKIEIKQENGEVGLVQ